MGNFEIPRSRVMHILGRIQPITKIWELRSEPGKHNQ